MDLYLIHWPVPRQGLYTDTWLALERLYAERRVRAIGVSNFEPGHLRAVLERGSVTPAVNQIELHPRLQQKELRALHHKYGITTEAWSPLGKGKLLGEPALKSVAERHGATPAQIILRWHLQVGNITMPKTVSPARMRENLRAAAIDRLDDLDLAVIGSLDANGRTGPHPDVFQ